MSLLDRMDNLISVLTKGNKEDLETLDKDFVKWKENKGVNNMPNFSQTIINSGKGKVRVNGRVFTGDVIIENGKVIQGNEIYEVKEKEINIVVEGNVDKIETGNGNIVVNGSCTNAQTTNGDITIKETLQSASTVNGDISANSVNVANSVNGDIIRK